MPLVRSFSTLRCAAVVVVIAVACLDPVPAAAQGAPTFSVAVTEPFELVEAAGTTHRIGRAELDARHARTLDDALRLIPGVYVRTGGDGTPRVDIRGFRSRHVLLLINGVLVNLTADGQFDPARISTAAICEIKVSYSSSSLLYGDNALAAVIEITTIDDRPDATLDFTAGTPDERGGGGRVSRRIGRWSMTSAGNPALRSERAYGVDMGAERRIGRASTVGVSAFATRATDFIERRAGAPFDNQGTYRFTGAELSVQTARVERLDVRGSYTFLDSVDVSAGSNQRQLQTRPRHRGSLEWTWTPVPYTLVRGSAQHVGRQLYDSRGSDPVQFVADAYTLVDLGFTHRWRVDSRSLST